MERQGRTSKIINIAPAPYLKCDAGASIFIAMRLLFIIAFYLFLHNSISGQPGFSKWFDFGTEATFHNILLDGDSLIICGSIWNEETEKLEALFLKMDTLGNISSFNTYADSLGSHLSFHKGYPIIGTSSGGYLIAGDLLNRQSDFLIIWDSMGVAEAFWEYPYTSNIKTSFLWDILEVADGFLLFSTKQIENFRLDVWVTKIDFNGDIIWENSYGGYDIDESIGSIWQEDENTIVLGCWKSTDQFVSLPSLLKCGSNWIFAIDSLGSIKWEWQSEPCEGDNVKGLHRTADGGWIYATREWAVFNPSNYGAAPKFVKRDSQFNLLWERQVAESYWDSNEMIDLKPTPDGNWVGAGLWLLPEPYNSLLPGYFYAPGCLYKVNEQGDSLWVRCDTVALDNPTWSHRYGGMAVLPSGSIVAAGGFEEFIFGVGDKSWAWVTKVDRHGCMEEPCLVTNVEEVKAKEKAFLQVYPNPARDQVTFDRIGETATAATLLLTDITGKVVWRQLFKEGVVKTIWHTSGIPGGIYFYRFVENGGKEWSGRVVLQK
ncbi:MAG: hypothetical protein CMN32_00885 [Saprospirales bacterium]|nr:hypothetical protein [Saprospirales bacterium]